MATAEKPAISGRWARTPFYFNSGAHLMRIGRERACNLAELLQALKVCPDESIFQHTFQIGRAHV